MGKKLLPALLIAAASCGGRTTLDEPLTTPEQSDASAPSSKPVVVKPQPQPMQLQPTQGEAGAPGNECAIASDACGSCVASRCASDVEACVDDASCPGGLSELQTCACADQAVEVCLGGFSFSRSSGHEPDAVLIVAMRRAVRLLIRSIRFSQYVTVARVVNALARAVRDCTHATAKVDDSVERRVRAITEAGHLFRGRLVVVEERARITG